MGPGYFPLRVRTGFSFGEGIVRAPELAQRLASLGLPGAAITDRMNVFGVPRFARALADQNLKALIGSSLRVVREGAVTDVSAICLSIAGFRSLSRLLTKAHTRSSAVASHVTADELQRDGDGLALIVDGALSSSSQAKALYQELATSAPGRTWLGVELAHANGREAAEIALRAGAKLVANDIVACLTAADEPALIARWCIESGNTIEDLARGGGVPSQISGVHLRSAAEMEAAYGSLAPALAETQRLAAMSAFQLTRERYHLPRMDDPAADSALCDAVRAGLEARLHSLPGVDAGAYQQRAEEELRVIAQTRFAGYFLLVHDFTAWARKNGVTVGPGRGSGAGSLVAWALGITDVDPIRHELIFERFLNAERVTLPDFDIDFCARSRDRVIQHLHDAYGSERVAQIATFSQLGAKSAVRDAARILGKPVSLADQISRAISGGSDLAAELADTGSALSNLRRASEDARAVLAVAIALEGLPRQTGTHAGGVIVCSQPIEEVAPLYRDPTSGSRIVQFDKDDAEAVGLVKFDLLGLTTLTIIDDTLASIAARTGEILKADALPIEDPLAYNLIAAGDVGSVFQLESEGMRQLLIDLKPQRFEDLVAAIALYRPGPLQSGMVGSFIAARHGKQDVVFPHPSLEPVLAPTYGVFVYQEQVMRAAQVVAGYTLGEADNLRRAMSKKLPDEMAKLRGDFIKRAVARGVVRRAAEKVFDLSASFAGYGFNKSHAVAYALLAARCAYLRAHYPTDFFAAALSFQGDAGARAVMVRDVERTHEVKVLAPDVLLSQLGFSAESSRSLRAGLMTIRGVGGASAAALVGARTRIGNKPQIEEWLRQVPKQHLNVRVVRALAASGALDRFGIAREVLHDSADQIARWADQSAAAEGSGQPDMFGPSVAATLPLARRAPWPDRERAERQREVLGFVIDADQLVDRHEEQEAQAIRTASIVEVARAGVEAFVVGTVEAARTVPGTNESALSISDPGGAADIYIPADVLQPGDAASLVGKVVVCRTWASGAGNKPYARTLDEIAVFRARECAELHVRIARAAGTGRQQVRERLAALLKGSARGRTGVRVRYGDDQGDGSALPADWNVAPTPDLLAAIRALVGRGNLKVVYRSRVALS